MAVKWKGGYRKAGIIKDELVGRPKINSQTSLQYLEDTFFKQWYRKKSASIKKTSPGYPYNRGSPR